MLCGLRAGATMKPGGKTQDTRAKDPYGSQEEFAEALDRFAAFYKILRKNPNESEEASIMRLAESLATNTSVLQVRSLSQST